MSKKEQIIEEIRKIYDPELPVNIYELGLIYDIKVKDEKFAIIKMTLTTPNCPVAESLPKEVNKLAEEINSSGGWAKGFGVDARDEDAIKSFFKEVEEEIAPIDVVIFNPGANVFFPIEDTTSRVFRKVWEMAAFAGFLTGREAAKYMKKRNEGSIFFTGARNNCSKRCDHWR